MQTSVAWLNRLATAPTGPDWQRLVDAYCPLLHERLRQLNIPAPDRDDLIQDTLMAVVAKVSEFEHRGPGAFRAWLRAIIANHVRKYYRERPDITACDLASTADDSSVLARQWDREHNEHLAAVLLKAVELEFSSITWQAFRRQMLDGQAPAEVARELGLSLNSVVLAKCRVLKRMRQEADGWIESTESPVPESIPSPSTRASTFPVPSPS